MPSSERFLRQKSPASSRRSFRRPSQASSPSPHRRTPPTTPLRRWINPSEPIDALHKCSSEPVLPGTFGGGSEDEYPSLAPDTWFYRQMTCTDVFSPHSHLLSSESLQIPREGYQNDAKVVVTVTVEGSTGPIRTMVKLGSSVEETIKLVIAKYGEEGRTPRLDKDAASSYDLHLSYFSLEFIVYVWRVGLDRKDSIGNVGSRNFYLRKGRSSHESTAMATEIVSAQEASHRQPCPAIVFLPAYITRKLTKFMRKMRKLWRVLGCFHCN